MSEMSVNGERVHSVIKHYRVGKLYGVEVREDGFDYEVDENALAAEVAKGANGDAKLETKRLECYKRHIEAIAKKLVIIRKRTKQGWLHGEDKIGVRVGKVVNKYKMAKHFVLHVEDNSFSYSIDQKKIDGEAALDGIYVVRTSVAKDT